MNRLLLILILPLAFASLAFASPPSSPSSPYVARDLLLCARDLRYARLRASRPDLSSRPARTGWWGETRGAKRARAEPRLPGERAWMTLYSRRFFFSVHLRRCSTNPERRVQRP